MPTYTHKQIESKQVSSAANLQAKSIAGKSGLYLTDNRTHTTSPTVIQPKENNTGLPDQLKSGVENLSGIAMDDVKVHYNSNLPNQIQAHAYAQGTNIHLAPGQEKHLPHEAWHVAQQKQGRVKPTIQLKGKVNVNDDNALEQEADTMGSRAMQFKARLPQQLSKNNGIANQVYQRAVSANEIANVNRSFAHSSVFVKNGANERFRVIDHTGGNYQLQPVDTKTGKHQETDVETAEATLETRVTAPVTIADATFATDYTITEIAATGIAVTPDEFLNNRPNSLPLLKNYLKHFLQDAYDLALSYYDTEKGDPKIEASFAALKNPVSLDDLKTKLTTLRTQVNQVLRRNNFKNIETRYSKTEGADLWDSTPDALKAMHKLITDHSTTSVKPRSEKTEADKEGNKINILKFSDIQDKIPKSLKNLLLDTYYANQAGRYIDTRANQVATNTTPTEPGSIRSWHEDSQKKLPANGFDAANIPAKSAALHTHYTQTSGSGSGSAAGAATAPTGYAEVTGTGIRADHHNSKIVLDYASGHVYLTLSHYQYWGKEKDKESWSADGQKLDQSEAKYSILHGPWIKIDMDI